MWGWDGGWWGGPLGGLWHVLISVFWGVAQLLALLVFVGVLILFVRFLLVGTRAAQLYISRHGPAAPAAAAPSDAASGTARTTTARTVPTTRPAATTARTTKRTPKPPTTPPMTPAP